VYHDGGLEHLGRLDFSSQEGLCRTVVKLVRRAYGKVQPGKPLIFVGASISNKCVSPYGVGVDVGIEVEGG
jgi:hypothetical protein